MGTRRSSYHEIPNHIYLGVDRDNPSGTTQFDFDESDVWGFGELTISEAKKQIPRKPAKKHGTAVFEPRPKATQSSSLPVNIPDWSKIIPNESRRVNAAAEDDGGDEDGRIPPHEYLARTRMASFSVHEGIGRTLKGRDLKRVRNAIWKQTGFED